ncbi:hypothetical protein GIB67_022419 [Kingdonia uniflora]|uniref:Uncharacterized protein n=1 Tax=Kingdonia uniflora TaxID=39325 RepID=A0A7J7MTU4_9MAGN|nr:hypothetical protein GIB67_022419 [Kingdonia uniflora]
MEQSLVGLSERLNHLLICPLTVMCLEFLLATMFLNRASELSAAELENLMTIVANPQQFKIPDRFLNRKKDYINGRYSQVVSNALDMKLRDDLERLKKISSKFCGFIWDGNLTLWL